MGSELGQGGVDVQWSGDTDQHEVLLIANSLSRDKESVASVKACNVRESSFRPEKAAVNAAPIIVADSTNCNPPLTPTIMLLTQP
jgi:hypothetical protein